MRIYTVIHVKAKIHVRISVLTSLINSTCAQTIFLLILGDCCHLWIRIEYYSLHQDSPISTGNTVVNVRCSLSFIHFNSVQTIFIINIKHLIKHWTFRDI